MEADKFGNNITIKDSMFLGQEKEAILKYLRKSIIGDFTMFHTPFGTRPLVYADYVASGRSLDFIEKYLVDCVLPFYANTHTYTSYVGAQTGSLREEARSIIKTCLNCSDEDMLIFVGSGSTGSINKIVRILNESNWGSIQGFFGQAEKGLIPCLACGEKFLGEGPFKKHLSIKHQQKMESFQNERPIVFASIYEHDSNLLPWREIGAEMVIINDDETGMLDLQHLRRELLKYSDRKFKIGTFSACSNVSGIVTDVIAVTDILKEHGALAFFDYAAGAPYLVMDMNPKGHHSVDGIFISGHKFIGGPGTPGLLCVKRKLIGNSTPTQTGGGTIFSITIDKHEYLENPEEREEGGTPDIIGAIRLGLVFHLKASIGDKFIMNTELNHFKNIVKRIEAIPNFELIGNTKAKRIPILSFRIKHENKVFHYGFISALLNDLFGIETRGGCACAGPYAWYLMKISAEELEKYNKFKLDGADLYAPGFSRLSINYFFSEQVIEYILEALNFISMHAIYFLPLYRFVLHKRYPIFNGNESTLNEIFSLKKLHLEHGKLKGQISRKANPENLNEYMKLAHKLLNKMKTRHIRNEELIKEPIYSEEMEELRWFVIPSEASQWIYNKRKDINYNFQVRQEDFKPKKTKDVHKLPYIQRKNMSPDYLRNKDQLQNKYLGKRGDSVRESKALLTERCGDSMKYSNSKELLLEQSTKLSQENSLKFADNKKTVNGNKIEEIIDFKLMKETSNAHIKPAQTEIREKLSKEIGISERHMDRGNLMDMKGKGNVASVRNLKMSTSPKPRK